MRPRAWASAAGAGAGASDGCSVVASDREAERGPASSAWLVVVEPAVAPVVPVVLLLVSGAVLAEAIKAAPLPGGPAEPPATPAPATPAIGVPLIWDETCAERRRPVPAAGAEGAESADGVTDRHQVTARRPWRRAWRDIGGFGGIAANELLD